MELQERVLSELKSLRKKEHGVTVETIADCPVICALLGNGDPLVAFSVLQQAVLAEEWSKPLEASSYSLGLASDRPTHLARLEEFAAQWFMDQRNARRLSDQGLADLARLISTNWAVMSAPCLDLVVRGGVSGELEIHAYSRRSELIQMQPLRISIRTEGDEHETITHLHEKTVDGIIRGWTATPTILPTQDEASLALVWRGELWPKFSVHINALPENVRLVAETLGNKAVITCHK